MTAPEVTREEAEAYVEHPWPKVAAMARTVVALYDLDAVKDECIDRLRDGWTVLYDSTGFSPPAWVRDDQELDWLTPEQQAVMAR